jgi:hypothetical protein
MRRLAVAVFIAILRILPADGLTVALACPGELRASWERFVAVHPLPAGITVVEDGPARAAESDVITVRLGEGPGMKTVDRVLVAPVGRLSPDGAPGIGGPAAPLEGISLPDVAQSVDGRTADQPDYPLQAVVAIGVEGADRGLKAWLDALPPAPARAAPALITWIGAVGDIMPARGVDLALLAAGGLQRVLGDTLPVLRSCDLLVGNLEAAATAGGTAERKSFTFRFDGSALQPLKAAGFSYLSIANNHSFDFGARGFLDTLDALARFGIGTSGAGANARAAAQPWEVRAGSLTARMLSFAAYPTDRRGFDGRKTARAREDRPGALWLDAQGLAAAAQGFAAGTFNIALVHGGEEWSSRPTQEQVQTYTALVRAGADIVIGSHPHVVQRFEALGGRLIAYSLGNFLFPGMEGTPGGEDSTILRVGVMNGRIRYVQAYPVRLKGTTVRLRD